MPPPDIELRRSLSLPLVTLYGLGNILGAGIYVLIGKIAGVAGYAAPVAFLVASLAAGFTAFTYAEFSSRLPTSAGAAVFLERGLGSQRLAGIAGFAIVAAVLVSAATLVNGFVGYLGVFVEWPRPATIVLVVLALSLIAGVGAEFSLRVTALFTLIEVAGLVLVIVAAGGSFGDLPERWTELLPGADFVVWQGVLVGAFLAFYAYTGFEDMVTIAEEVREPESSMPLAIVFALLISTLLYAAIAVVSVLTVAPEALAVSHAPLALVYSTATGGGAGVIAVISLFAVVNGALVQIIMSSRMLFGMSRRGWLPRCLGVVHPRTHTPLRPLAVVSMIILILALSFSLVGLAATTSFFLLVIFTLVNSALLRLKLREPRPPGVRVFPGWVPAIGLFLSLALLVLQGVSLDAWHG